MTKCSVNATTNGQNELALSQNQTASAEPACQIMNSQNAQYVAESIVMKNKRLTEDSGFLTYAAVPSPNVRNADARHIPERAGRKMSITIRLTVRCDGSTGCYVRSSEGRVLVAVPAPPVKL